MMTRFHCSRACGRCILPTPMCFTSQRVCSITSLERCALWSMFRKTPNSYRVNQISAEVFEIQNRYPEAISEYRKAIEKNPAALNLHFRLGRALLLESHSPDNLALARREFEAELALNPADAVAEYETG